MTVVNRAALVALPCVALAFSLSDTLTASHFSIMWGKRIDTNLLPQFFSIPGIEPRALHTLGKCSSTELSQSNSKLKNTLFLGGQYSPGRSVIHYVDQAGPELRETHPPMGFSTLLFDIKGVCYPSSLS